MLNATAAVAVALDLDIPFAKISTALANFKGIDRRFTFKGTYKAAELFDDYGHHPTEIHHTLLVARKRAHKKLIVMFQPHRYSRTKGLWDDFITVFKESKIDHLIITDIYAASEAPIKDITAQAFTKALQAANPSFTISYQPYDDSFSHLKNQLDAVVEAEDLVLLLGAGKMNKIVDKLTVV